MSNATVTRGGGLGLSGALFLVFLVLKLIGEISWSWWWVTSPLWIPWVVFFTVLVVALILTGVLNLFESKANKQGRKARKALDDYRRSLR